jgi:hypothetical protein
MTKIRFLMVPVPLFESWPRGRFETDFVGRPTENLLQPTAQERYRYQQTYAAKLPPEIRDRDESKARADTRCHL